MAQTVINNGDSGLTARTAINDNFAQLFTGTVAIAPAATLTADAPFSWAQTWNNAAITFTGIRLTITDTASDAASKLIDLRVGAGSVFSVNKAGVSSSTGQVIVGGTVTASTPLASLTQTWNSAGVTFIGWLLNITSTAAAAASRLFDLQKGGATQFAVVNDGSLIFSTGQKTITGLTGLYVDAATGFGGSATAPRIYMSGSFGVQVRNDFLFGWSSTTDADVAPDTAFSRMNATGVALGNGTAGDTTGGLTLQRVTTVPLTVATLPAAVVGRRCAVTDANATLTAGIGTVVAGGGSNTVPVFYDGTNWRIG